MRFDEAIRSGVQIRLLTVKNDGTYPTHSTCRIEGVDVVVFWRNLQGRNIPATTFMLCGLRQQTTRYYVTVEIGLVILTIGHYPFDSDIRHPIGDGFR